MCHSFLKPLAKKPQKFAHGLKGVVRPLRYKRPVDIYKLSMELM